MAEPLPSFEAEDTSQSFSSETTFGVLSCTYAQQWVSVTPQDEGYVYAVGSATVRYESLSAVMRRAQENARGELSKQLMVSIEANTDVSTVRRRTENGVSYASTLRERIISKAPHIELSGISIVERCIDQRENTVFVLAKLNRDKAIDGLFQQIAQLDEEIGRYISTSSAIPKIEQIRRLLPSLDLITKREKLATTLEYISGSPPGIATNTVVVKRRISNLLDSLSIALHPGGRDAKSIEPYVAEHLTNQGFRISSIGLADIVLGYQLQMRSVIDQGIYFVYANGEMAVVDTDGRLVNMFKVDAKGGSPISISRARDQAVKQIGRQLGELVVELLLADS